MPLFEYICQDCENRFEALVLSSEEEVLCPACESQRLEKLFSPFARTSGGSSTGCSGGRGFS
ncbi:MAG: zinc ribbon domain-containing protein [Thermodesulfobacteriota bacterium]